MGNDEINFILCKCMISWMSMGSGVKQNKYKNVCVSGDLTIPRNMAPTLFFVLEFWLMYITFIDNTASKIWTLEDHNLLIKHKHHSWYTCMWYLVDHIIDFYMNTYPSYLSLGHVRVATRNTNIYLFGLKYWILFTLRRVFYERVKKKTLDNFILVIYSKLPVFC